MNALFELIQLSLSCNIKYSQALPLVTIVAGKQNGTRDVNIYTTANDVDEPKKIKFSLNDRIEPGN